MVDEPQEETTPVYDISTKEPVLGDIPHSSVQDAIASGGFSFPKGQQVPVVAPDGTHGTIPADQAIAAFNAGYQYATPGMRAAQADRDTYGTTGQQIKAGLEGVAQGLAGPLAPAAERLAGVSPEAIRKRAEINPWTHGLSEAAGFVGGMFTGASEASLLGHAGEAAAIATTKAITHGVAKSASQQIGAKIASGAARAVTEMAAFQAGDEATKAILKDPNQSVGSAALNVGLSGILGGIGGGAVSGLGMATKAGIKAAGFDGALKEFTDRLAYRGANLNPNEAMQHELETAVNAYHSMGSEVGGAEGIKAQALSKIMPEMGPKITEQAEGLINKTQETIERLGDDPLAKRLQNSLDSFKQTVSRGSEAWNPYMGAQPAPASAAEVFDATQRFKQQLQEWSKFNKLTSPPISERAFISATKNLGHSFRVALEDPETWGRVAELQSKINKEWFEGIPVIKQIESKFMTEVGNDRVIDPIKFNTYVNQSDKVTSQTTRQQLVRKFIDTVDKFHDATSLAYDAAEVANPHPSVGMSSLRDSIEKKSPWSKLADLYYDRAISNAAGTTVGAAIGGGLGHATGIPGVGLAGSLLGGKLGEKILPAIIQPLMTKSLNSGALQQAVKFSEKVIRGNSQLVKSSAEMFSLAAKTIPQHFMPSDESRAKLDKQLEYAANNPSAMFDIGGDLGHYMPDHQTALAQHAQTAVNYLNGLRPKNPKMSPLDSEVPVSKEQMATFNRQLDIAEQPLLVFQHIKQATLLPQDMMTLKTIYPALYPKMVEQVTHSMTDHLSKEGSIPYRLRQSLSAFIGQPLDSTMTPQSIVSIQSTFAQAGPKPQQGAAPSRAKKNTSKLNKIAMDTQTPNQAREARSSKT